jgi:BlaI family transcriptional regulator, penicillinase repressor
VGKTLPGGELEYAVLIALWDLGSATAREVHTRAGQPQGLVYTTIAKVLDRLHAKRLVHRELDGKAFVYRAAVKRDRLDRDRARRSLEVLLGDDPRPAVAGIVDAMASIDPELLDELARVIEVRRSRPGSHSRASVNESQLAARPRRSQPL